MDYTKIDAYIDAHKDELIADIGTLVSFDSERRDPEDGAPFGREAAECLAAAVKIVERTGFAAKNYDSYIVTADFDPALEPGLDILAHLDVVPAGNGWTKTDPFKMLVEGDKIYGRGTTDDKGPALAALYAMRAVKECGVPLSKNVRLIMGSDEECGSSDLDYYFAKEKSAPMSVSPDADYPVINIEKGGVHAAFKSDAKIADTIPRVISINAGIKINVVPDTAEAVVEGLTPEEASGIAGDLGIAGCKFNFEREGTRLRITAKGKTAHASTPETGVNALTALLALLSHLPLSDSPLHRQLQGAAILFPHGDFNGRALGIDLSDEVSGKTTLTLDILNYSESEGLSGMYDCRACLSANDQNTLAVINDKLRAAGLEPFGGPMFEAHSVPADSPLVQTLLGIWKDMTGKDAEPLCIGGGTYVHHIDNGVAFGPEMPGLENYIHAADEFISLDQLIFTCKAYARAIVELCGNGNM